MPRPKPQEITTPVPPVTPATPTEPDRALLTVAQAADYLHVSQSSVRSYIRQGQLKAFRVAGSRSVRIARDELVKLLLPAHPS